MKKWTSLLVLLCFVLTGSIGPCPAYAQEFILPAPGVMVPLSPVFNPSILKGIKVHPDNPFKFEFILDQGDHSSGDLQKDATRLIKYFLASLTIPEKDLWVNLSPYEKDRIIPQSLGLTEMGRDMLAEDYMLKQITASLIYPENRIGKRFWKRVYEEAVRKYGTTNIPVNTFNKVWIIPDKAVVYENAQAGTAYIIDSRLKVMLEQDYLALEKNSERMASPDVRSKTEVGIPTFIKEMQKTSEQVVREIVIPELTKEVNEDKNFAQLRQVYNSLILATWYKNKVKDSLLAEVYSNRNKVAGIRTDDPQEKDKIYQRYLQAFKRGVYNYIKEDLDPVTQQPIPRKYFSGGEVLGGVANAMKTLKDLSSGTNETGDFVAGVVIAPTGNTQQAMANKPFTLAKAVTKKEIFEAIAEAKGVDGELRANVIQILISSHEIPKRAQARLGAHLDKLGFVEPVMDQEKYFADLLKEVDRHMVYTAITEATKEKIPDNKLVTYVVNKIKKEIGIDFLMKDLYHAAAIRARLRNLGFKKLSDYTTEQRLLEIGSDQIMAWSEGWRHENTAEEGWYKIKRQLAITGANEARILERLDDLKLKLEDVRVQRQLLAMDEEDILKVMRGVQNDLKDEAYDSDEEKLKEFYDFTVVEIVGNSGATEEAVKLYLSKKMGIDLISPAGKHKLGLVYEKTYVQTRLQEVTKDAVATMLASADNHGEGIMGKLASHYHVPPGDLQTHLERLYADEGGWGVFLAANTIGEKGIHNEAKFDLLREKLNDEFGQMMGVDRTQLKIDDNRQLRSIFEKGVFLTAIRKYQTANSIWNAANSSEAGNKGSEASQEFEQKKIMRKLALLVLYLIASKREIRDIFKELYSDYADTLKKFESEKEGFVSTLTPTVRKYLESVLILFGKEDFSKAISSGRVKKGEVYRKREKLGALSAGAPERSAYEFLYSGSSDIRVTPEQVEEFRIEKGLNNAMFTKRAKVQGGIDFTAQRMKVLGESQVGNEIEFKINPAMLNQLRNASGFAPMSVTIQPLKNLRVFLGA